MVPLRNVSRPPIVFNSVVLPDPLSPRIHTEPLFFHFQTDFLQHMVLVGPSFIKVFIEFIYFYHFSFLHSAIPPMTENASVSGQSPQRLPPDYIQRTIKDSIHSDIARSGKLSHSAASGKLMPQTSQPMPTHPQGSTVCIHSAPTALPHSHKPECLKLSLLHADDLTQQEVHHARQNDQDRSGKRDNI